MRHCQMQKGCLFGVCMLAILVSTSARADETVTEKKNDHVWKPKTSSATIFKNGLGFFIREGEVTLRDGWCLADQVPPAAFGTLAIYAQDEKEAVDIVGSGPGRTLVFDGHDYPEDDTTKRKELLSLEQLDVELTYLHKGETQTASGKLVSVGPEFAILDSASGNFAVSVESITKLQVLKLPLRIHVASDVQDTDGAQGDRKTTLGIAYLRKGVTWIPDYTLRILDNETAELTLRGTIVNQAEDLIHTDVHLVVGVPHFVHTDQLTPLAVGQILRTIGASVVPQQIQSQMMNRAAMVQNVSPQPDMGGMGGMPGGMGDTVLLPQPVDDGASDLAAAIGNLPQMNAAAATDYTTYTQKDLTLRCGEKAIVTLFTKKIKFDHIYRWDTNERIKHSLVLKNTTDSAWTTGPCLAVSDQRPLSEELLKYVPRGASGELEITEAINIAHEKTEQEIDRKLKEYTPRSNDPYDLVTLEGKITLRNFEDREANVVVTCLVPGKPTEASDEGQAAIDSSELRLTARNGKFDWNIKLAPGEKKIITYQYERYVKSYDDGSRDPNVAVPAVNSNFFSPVPVSRPTSPASKGG